MSDPAAIVRAERKSRNLRQADLAELLHVTQPFVSELERGLVYLPGDAVRAKLVEHLGADPFAERAAERDGKVSASELARRTHIDVHSILRLIDDELLPAHFLGEGLGYDVDESEALAALDALPRCRYEGCDEPATTETGCCGDHAQKQWAIEARGTERSAAERERIREGRVRCDNATWRGRIAAAKRGKPRPDVRERVAVMHADSKQHAKWGLATMTGRAKRSVIPANTTMKKWKNRVNGHEGGRHRLDADPEYNDVLQEIRDDYAQTRDTEENLLKRARSRHSHFNGGKGVSRRMVRLALGRGI